MLLRRTCCLVRSLALKLTRLTSPGPDGRRRNGRHSEGQETDNTTPTNGENKPEQIGVGVSHGPLPDHGTAAPWPMNADGTIRFLCRLPLYRQLPRNTPLVHIFLANSLPENTRNTGRHNSFHSFKYYTRKKKLYSSMPIGSIVPYPRLPLPGPKTTAVSSLVVRVKDFLVCLGCPAVATASKCSS